MELALNLCWLAVVVTAFVLWLRHPRYRGRRVRSRWEWVAGALVLACVLVLIFPVISISDDVRAAREFLEEPSPDQPLAKSLELQKRFPVGQLPTPEAALAQPATAFGFFHTLGIVDVADLRFDEVAPLRLAHGRSPPLV